jgi:hypothetical protein
MEISVGLIITQIIDIDFRDSSLDFNVVFIAKWRDELIDILEENDGKVHMGNVSAIWTPDFYIYNLKKFEIKKTDHEFSTLTLNKNGSAVDVCYIFEAEVVISCNAEFADFPFHQHECSLEIGSFTKSVNKLLFSPDHKYQSETQVELTMISVYLTSNILRK